MQKSINKIKTRLPVYAGVSFEKDGFQVAIVNNSETFINEFVKNNGNQAERKLYSWLYCFAVENYVKIIGVGFAKDSVSSDLMSDLWLKADMLPFHFNINGSDPEKKAEKAAWLAYKRFGEDNIVDIRFGSKRQVKDIWLGDLGNYKQTSTPEDFERLVRLAEKFKKSKGVMVFFSSTPRGGGVALMRHSLIRIYRLLGVDAHWYVMSSKHSVFQITKKKFHNILQGVAPPGTKFTDQDKKVLRMWIEKNAHRFKDVIRKANVIVIDDPQPSGMIPYIKKFNPQTKIIYRSHIQIESSLVDKKSTVQNDVWNYLWKSIKYADLYVSHPVEKFIPKNVPSEKTLMMTASTDKLDGLNKHLSDNVVNYYLEMFNKILKKNPLHQKRPYIIQVARFDPSKGIPDVIESYRKLREMLEKKQWETEKIPQLVIVGHGAIDDPEGGSIYGQTINLLSMYPYRKYSKDIKVALLPPSDQLLNALLRKCRIALQLSHKEGFEVKVSEALDKGKPVIAYKAGGIPLQIENGVTGFLVEIGETEKVARHLYELITDKKLYKEMSKNACEKVNRDYFTVSNAAKWLFLAIELAKKGKITGNRRLVRKLMEQAKI